MGKSLINLQAKNNIQFGSSILFLVSLGITGFASFVLFPSQSSGRPPSYRCIPITAAQRVPPPPDGSPGGISVFPHSSAPSNEDLRPVCPSGQVPQPIPKKVSKDFGALPFPSSESSPSHGLNSVPPSPRSAVPPTPSSSDVPPTPANFDSAVPPIPSLKEQYQASNVGKSSGNGSEYQCIRESKAQKIPTPPDNFVPSLDNSSSSKLDPFLEPVCPSGQVPQPIAKFPASPDEGLDPFTARSLARRGSKAATNYFSYGYQNISSVGLGGSLTIHRPVIRAGSTSGAKLFAINGTNNIQLGWIVDPNLNNGSTYPYLFVYSSGGSAGSCYNGCGFVQRSSKIFPGRQVTLSNTSIPFRIQYFSGNWWVWYKAEWFGYFPGSLWSNRFTSSTRSIWAGNVFASVPATCTDMGNGYKGTSNSTVPAYMYNMFTYRLGGLVSDALASYANTNAVYYDTSPISGKYFRYGGPGAC